MSGRIRILPGLAGSPRQWDEVVTLLRTVAPEVDVAVADLPWHSSAGGSWAHAPGAPHQWLAGAFADGDVVVAHSFAATLLLAHCSDGAGPQPASIVLVSPFYRTRAAEFDWDHLAHYLGEFHHFLEQGLRSRRSRRIDPDIKSAMAKAVRNRMGPYAWLAFMTAYLQTPQLPVQAIRTPACVIAGTRDDVASAQEARALVAQLPDAELQLFSGVDHFPMCADPVRTMALILRSRDRATRRPVPTDHHLARS